MAERLARVRLRNRSISFDLMYCPCFRSIGLDSSPASLDIINSKSEYTSFSRIAYSNLIYYIATRLIVELNSSSRVVEAYLC